MKAKFKRILRNNGQSLKWFWSKHLRQKVSYQYFIIQLNGSANMQKNIEAVITNFMIKGEKNEN